MTSVVSTEYRHRFFGLKQENSSLHPSSELNVGINFVELCRMTLHLSFPLNIGMDFLMRLGLDTTAVVFTDYRQRLGGVTQKDIVADVSFDYCVHFLDSYSCRFH